MFKRYSRQGSMDSVGEPPDDEIPAVDLVDDWVMQKGHAQTSGFLYLTVEYVGEQDNFFEPGAPFSPQSSSLPEFENHTSPLDPNMSPVAQYTPVFTGQVGEPPPTTTLANSESSMENVLYQPVVSVAAGLPHVVQVAQTTSSSSPGPDTPLSINQQVAVIDQQSSSVAVELLVSQLDANGETIMLDENQLGSVLRVLKNEALSKTERCQEDTKANFGLASDKTNISQSSEKNSFAETLEKNTFVETLQQTDVEQFEVHDFTDELDDTDFVESLERADSVESVKMEFVEDSLASAGFTNLQVKAEFVDAVLLDEFVTVSDKDVTSCLGVETCKEGKPNKTEVQTNLPQHQEAQLLFLTMDSQHHQEDTLTSEVRLWKCFSCDQTFAYSAQLQKHLNYSKCMKENKDEFSMLLRSHRYGVFRGRPVLLQHDARLPRHIRRAKSWHGSRQYACHRCGRLFSRSSNLNRHLMMLHVPALRNGNYEHRLSIRGQRRLGKMSRKTRGRRHSRTLLCKNVTRECGYCGLRFNLLSLLELHSLIHRPDYGNTNVIISAAASGEATCPQCSQVFANRARLMEHVATHAVVTAADSAVANKSSNPTKPYKCDMCYKCFASEERLQRHMMVHGAEELKPLQCNVCYKRFLNNSALTCHLKIHTGKKAFECPICKATFEQVLALKEHVQIHSTDGLFTCPHCKKVFDGYSLIRKHIRAFHSDRKHACICCGKPFPTQDKLRMHMLKHSDHREFLCANCGKQFKRKDKLKEHMKRMHSAEREREHEETPHGVNYVKNKVPTETSPQVDSNSSSPTTRKSASRSQSQTDFDRFIYKCHSCLVGFKRRGMLVNHLAKRHPEIAPDTVPELNLPILRTTRDYFCQYCEKVYKSSSKRKAHILKIHPGAELPLSNRRKGGIPEIPGLPDPTFSQTVGSVTTHPHGCQWCHKQYASKAKLLQHQRKKHMDLLPLGQQLPRGQRTSSSSGGNPASPVGSGSGSSRSPQRVNTSPVPQSSTAVEPDDNSADVDDVRPGSADLLVDNVINIFPADYEIATEEHLQQLQEPGIIIDASALRDRAFKELHLTVPGGHFLHVSTSPWQQQAGDPDLASFAAAEPPR